MHKYCELHILECLATDLVYKLSYEGKFTCHSAEGFLISGSDWSLLALWSSGPSIYYTIKGDYGFTYFPGCFLISHPETLTSKWE